MRRALLLLLSARLAAAPPPPPSGRGPALALALLAAQARPPFASAQFLDTTGLYKEAYEHGVEVLKGEVQSHEDVELLFYPEREYFDRNRYMFDEPNPIFYQIGLLVEPCKTLGYDCCVNMFGSPNYGQATTDPMPYYRGGITLGDNVPAIHDIVAGGLAPADEILANVQLVTEDLEPIDATTSRRADDETYLATECTGVGEPYGYCQGVRKGQRLFTLQPNCTDNNETVVAGASCFDHAGNEHEDCVQVAYTQSAFIVQCGAGKPNGEFVDDPHCGTYLEVHRKSGSPYHDEEFIISDVQLLTMNTSGYNTTYISTRYGNQSSGEKVLCNYEEEVLRVGSMVLILKSAPSCCCPGAGSVWYNDQIGRGMKMCPKNVLDKTSGPFAGAQDTQEEWIAADNDFYNYPFCPPTSEDEDVMYCIDITKYPECPETPGQCVLSNRRYMYPCVPVESVNATAAACARSSSADACKAADSVYSGVENELGNRALDGVYRDKCPYFEGCGLSDGTFECPNCYGEARTVWSDCGGEDYPGLDKQFTFAGRVGKVTFVPEDDAEDYMVSFNDGRTSYPFQKEHLQMEHSNSNYEIWWVQRTRYNFIVQKRKGFKVTEPVCTFDDVNDRYFPYAIRNPDTGQFLDTLFFNEMRGEYMMPGGRGRGSATVYKPS